MAVETYECILSGKCAGQFVQNILHCNVNNVGSISPFRVADDLLQTWNDSGGMIEQWCNCLPTDYTLTSVRSRRVLAQGGPTQIMLQGQLSEDTGQRSGKVSVASNSPLIIWIPITNSAKTGRTFLPGVSESDIEEMVLSASILTNIDTFATLWRDGGTTLAEELTWQGSILRRAINTGHDIGQYRISPIIGNQRRRQRPI